MRNIISVFKITVFYKINIYRDEIKNAFWFLGTDDIADLALSKLSNEAKIVPPVPDMRALPILDKILPCLGTLVIDPLFFPLIIKLTFKYIF